MFISIPNVIFACLSLASAGASLSNGDLLKMIQEQEGLIQEQAGSIQELKNTIDKLVDNEGSSNKMRTGRLKGGIQNKVSSGGHRALSGKSFKSSKKGGKDRNICYSSEESEDYINVFVACEALLLKEEYAKDAYARCQNGRRLLTHDEARRNLQALSDERKLNFNTSPPICAGANDTDTTVLPIGFYPVGAVKIEKDESLMVELTASTLNLAGNINHVFNGFPNVAGVSGLDIGDNDFPIQSESGFETFYGTEAGVYVTVSMWEDCDSWESCNVDGTVEVTPEPRQWIPIHVVALNRRDYHSNEAIDERVLDTDHAFEQTTTVKLFFPDSNLVDDKTYFMTLQFRVEAAAGIMSCVTDGVQTYMGIFSEATLGPYIIDTQIIKDADFGNCAWIDPDKGCGLFDGSNCGE
jgi:hypothetical protein